MLKIIDQNYAKRITPVSTGRYNCFKNKLLPKNFPFYSIFLHYLSPLRLFRKDRLGPCFITPIPRTHSKIHRPSHY